MHQGALPKMSLAASRRHRACPHARRLDQLDKLLPAVIFKQKENPGRGQVNTPAGNIVNPDRIAGGQAPDCGCSLWLSGS